MNKIATFDSSQVDAMLSKLNPDRRTKILTKALKEGGKTLQQQTKDELAKTGIRYYTPSRFNGKTLESGIRLKTDNAYNEVSVNIMGDFRLKFFEKGTKQRYTKGRKITGYMDSHRLKREGKGSSKGAIKATHFFAKARQNESKIEESIIKVLDKEL